MGVWRFWAVMVLTLGIISAYVIHRDLDWSSNGGFSGFYACEN
jgi:hypothetical protein